MIKDIDVLAREWADPYVVTDEELGPLLGPGNSTRIDPGRLVLSARRGGPVWRDQVALNRPTAPSEAAWPLGGPVRREPIALNRPTRSATGPRSTRAPAPADDTGRSSHQQLLTPLGAPGPRRAPTRKPR